MQNVPTKRQHLIAAGIFMIALALFYRDVVFLGRTFLMESSFSFTTPEGPYNYEGVQPGFVTADGGAMAWYSEPYNSFIGDSIKRGDFPLWNPYSGPAGAPLYADGQMAPLEPIQFLFFLLPRRLWPYGMDVQLLIRFFLAGFFSYLFARRLGIGFAGSVTAGLLFMLQAYFAANGNHPKIKTEALLPLVLYGYDRVTDLEDRRSVWFCALFIGWALIAGMPESVFFSLFFGTLWYFYKIIFIKQQVELKAFLRYITATGIGILLAAVFLLPLFEFISNSKSVHHFSSFFAAEPWGGSIAIHRIPELIFGSAPFGLNFRIGYIAILFLVFAFLNFKEWPEAQKEILFFGGYAGIFMLSIYALPFVNWILRLPILNQIVVYKYMYPSVNLSVAILAGIVIDRSRKSTFSRQKLIAALLLVCGFMVILPKVFAPPDYQFPNSYSLILGLSLAMIAISYFFENKRQLLQIALILIVLFQVFTSSWQFTRPSRFYPYQAPLFVDYLRQDASPFRILGLEKILYPNISTAYQIRDIRWLYALIPERAYDFSAQFIESEQVKRIRYTGTAFPKSKKMMDLLGVKYILSESNLGEKIVQPNQLEKVYRGESIHIYKNENAFPNAFVSYNIINVDNLESAMQEMQAASFDPRKSAVVENFPQELSDQINQQDGSFPMTAGDTELVSSGQINVSVKIDAPGLLVVSEQYYPGWVAYVDGKPAPIYAVDGILRGVFLEKGQHHIEFKYRPVSFMAGAFISLILFCFVTAMLIRSRRRTDRAPAPNNNHS